MKPTLAILLSLALLGSIAAARAADRLSFTHDAPALYGGRLTNVGTYYSTASALTTNAALKIVPVATCTNLPLGSLSRRIWAWLLAPNAASGQRALEQYGQASGAIRFYRGTNLVAELPYRSGGVAAQTTDTGTNCLITPRLFGELGYKATGGTYYGQVLPVDPARMLTVESDAGGFCHANAIPGVDVSIDCDSARFEIDTYTLTGEAYSGTGVIFPGHSLVPFLAILSQPPP